MRTPSIVLLLLLYLIKRLLANFFSYQPTVLDGIRILLKKMI